jgi:FkbM family methyltransferase
VNIARRIARRLKRTVRDVVRPQRADHIDLRAPWKNPQGPATAEDIYYAFRLLLGRAPNREEWDGHVGQAGSDLDAVVRSYLSSLEFSRRADLLLGHRLNASVSLAKLKGFAMYVQEGDAAVGQHVKRDKYEPNVTAVFRERVRQGMHVLDVGANIGYFTMLSASLVGPTGSVIAIEPNPESAKLLEASRRANSFQNVTVFQVAAGRAPELLVLHGNYSNAMTSAVPDEASELISSITVPSFKIDELVPRERKIDFVKIDVEGAEYNALMGASELITRWRPTIVSEFSPQTMPGISGVDGRTYLRFLLGFGYTIAVIEPDGSLQDCGKDPERVMDAYAKSGVDHIDILLT